MLCGRRRGGLFLVRKWGGTVDRHTPGSEIEGGLPAAIGVLCDTIHRPACLGAGEGQGVGGSAVGEGLAGGEGAAPSLSGLRPGEDHAVCLHLDGQGETGNVLSPFPAWGGGEQRASLLVSDGEGLPVQTAGDPIPQPTAGQGRQQEREQALQFSLLSRQWSRKTSTPQAAHRRASSAGRNQAGNRGAEEVMITVGPSALPMTPIWGSITQ